MRSVIGAAIAAAATADFEKNAARDQKLRHDAAIIQTGLGDYYNLMHYAVRLGELLGRVVRTRIEADGIQEIREDLATDLLLPPLFTAYADIADACVTVQNDLNHKAGVALKAVRPELPRERAADLAVKLGSYETTESALWILEEPLISWCLHIVDETVRVNAEAQAAAGLSPTVRRSSDSADCSFCMEHAGIYAPPLAHEIFRRHERCRCLIALEPSKAPKDVPTRLLYKGSADAERKSRIKRVLDAEKRTNR